MPQIVDQPGMARIRIGAWMMIAGSLGAILALLTWIDVWDVSDTKPTGWAIAAALCAVLALAGFVVCFKGLQEKSQAAASAAAGTPRAPQDPPSA
jgi:Na+/melibiose symporter-like transporter